MKSLLKSIADLPRHYIELIIARVGALLMLFAILIILTLFGAFVMLTRWQWTPEHTFLVCFLPWILIFVVLIIISMVSSHKLKEDKQRIYEAGRQHLAMQVLGMVFATIFKRSKDKKSKKAHHTEK